MKRCFIVGVTAFFVVVLAGCSNHLLTLSDIEETFENEGIKLEQYTEEVHPDNVFTMELNGVKPLVFGLNDNMTSLYIYDSERGSKAGKEDFENKTAAASVVEHTAYEVKNALIFYVHERNRNSNIETKIQNAINKLEKLN